MKQPFRKAVFALAHRIEFSIYLVLNKGLTGSAVLTRLHHLLCLGENSTFRVESGTFFIFKKLPMSMALKNPSNKNSTCMTPRGLSI